MNRAKWKICPAAVVLLSAAWLASASLAQATAIRTAGYVDVDGKIGTSGLVVIEDGMIARVGGGLPANIRVEEYPGAVLSPGLIDCQGALGAYGNLTERETAIQPHANARDALDRHSQHLSAALAAGVTTFALVPDDQNLIGGRIAICQTSGRRGEPRLLTDRGPLKLSLSSDAFKVDREPTSRGAALGMLRETIETARRDDTRNDALAEFAQGRLTGLITTPSGADVLAALDLAETYGLAVVLDHTRDAQLIAGQVSGRTAGVIVGPFDLNTPRREALAPSLFEHHGAKVALAGGLPVRSADSLRIGAAVAVRAGLSLEAARRAITSVPAELLGVGDRIGAIKPGFQADLVVFSGDPLDLRSRVLAVYVGGRRVYSPEAMLSVGELP